MATEPWIEIEVGATAELGMAEAVGRLVRAIGELRTTIVDIDRVAELRYKLVAADLAHLKSKADALHIKLEAGASQAALMDFRRAMNSDLTKLDAKIDMLVGAMPAAAARS